MSNENQFNDEGWSSWKKYVVKSLEALQKNQEKYEDKEHEFEKCVTKDLTELKTKSKFTSAVVSIIIALIITLIGNVFGAYLINKNIIKKHNLSSKTTVQEVLKKTEKK